MEAKLKIKIIIGSTRPKRFSEHAGAWIYGIAKGHDNMEVEILDLRDFPLPFYNEPISPSSVAGDYANEEVNKWAKKIAEADGFIIVTPEYNRGPSAVLKNALDSVYKEWNKKAVGVVSYGSVGGARAAEQLRSSFVELQMTPIRAAVNIQGGAWNLMEENGSVKPGTFDNFEHSAKAMLEQLEWWTRALKTARENK